MTTYHSNNEPCGAGWVLAILDAIDDGREMSPFMADTMRLLASR